MRRILYVVVFASVCLVIQFMPTQYITNSYPIFIADVWADEAQEMAERAPLILQAAYEGDWQKVIAIAKKNPDRLKDVDDLGCTVLHEAAARASDAVVIELLKLGADKNAKNYTSQKDRPYDYAQWNKNISTKVRNMLR